ncbi:Photosystem I assembly protein Ycf3 [Sporomusa silvacetica DSM 10669]|uniref:Photosystem I assembly protein Ycf3 n=1 Tax=Sporomusa silvacetica DSM 10669 TaxID=1123289 RepID=A0ABZ3IUN6_9FIRM|nr:tetratricopeptide repeat protein [Sporomusa silvacetica]OZC16620.1 TPR repeat-containing protein YrrB [Sporomusa silvacetica DSM 10669]
MDTKIVRLNNRNEAANDEGLQEEYHLRQENADCPEAFYNLGLLYRNAGRFGEAESCFCRAIELKPDYPEALYQLGLLFEDTNRLDEAAAFFYQAIKMKPSWADSYLSLGLVLKKKNRLKGAEACLLQAIELKPDFPEAYNSLALILCDMSYLDRAQACLCRAIELRPDYSEAYNNLGVVQTRRKLTNKAANSFRRAAELDKDNPYIFNNLGVALYDLNRQDEAQTYFCQAIELKPDYSEAYYNLGRVLKKMNDLDGAVKYFRQAIDLKPDYLLPYNSLAVVLIITNRLEEAEKCLRQAIKLKPDYADAHRKLGRALKMMHRVDEAEAAYLRAIEVSTPEQVEDCQFGLGILYLLRGQYTKGWERYDLRRKLYKYSEPDICYWQGENLTGRKILLFNEQGLGDTIQFVRYVQQVAMLASETVVRVQEPLKRLLTDSLHFSKVYSGANMPSEHYDFACSLHSLPFAFQTSEKTIPKKIPYLWASPKIVKKWRSVLNQADGGQLYRVGIVWAGNPKHHNDHNRSIPFELFSELLVTDQVSWVSLQVGDRAKDLLKTDYKVIDFSQNLTDFYETAGVVENLDLVITVDSAAAHLSGAMGKKTWILLPFAPDWRWQLDREDSPWYGTARLFRQRRINDWQEVLLRVKDALGKIVKYKNRES